MPVGPGLTIVHGGCPTGLDWIAKEFCLNSWIADEEHKADWERICDGRCTHKPRYKNNKSYCPYAGWLRNQHMVDLGADVCLAFPLDISVGTRDCINRAKRASIPVIEYAGPYTPDPKIVEWNRAHRL